MKITLSPCRLLPLAAVTVAIAGLWAGPLFTASAAATYVTHTNQVPLTTRARPSYNAANPLDAAFMDDAFGQTVVRVSGEPGDTILLNGKTKSTQVWPFRTCHHYQRTEAAWNCDASLLLLDGCSNRYGIMLDGNTFKVVMLSPKVGSGYRLWSRTDPDVMYALGGNTVLEYHVSTNQSKTLWTIDGYSKIYDNVERQFADDGQTMAVHATRSSDGKLVSFALNVVTGKKSTDIVIPATNDSGNTYNNGEMISASGKYIIIGYGYGGVDQDIYEVATGKIAAKYRGGVVIKHFDTAFLDGRDYTVGEYDKGGSPYLYSKRDVLTGEVTDLAPRLGYPNHTSTRMYKDGRWAIVSYDDGRSTSMFRLEVVAIRIDGGQGDQIRRLAQDMGRRYTYSDETHANPSPDGKKVVFASNWCGGTTDTLPTSAYVILLPDWDTPSQATAYLPGPRGPHERRGAATSDECELIGLDGRVVKRLHGVRRISSAHALGVPAGAYLIRVAGLNGSSMGRVIVPGASR
jgi:hypothetical protein